MAKKLYDLAVKTGSYTGADGQPKGRWQNVGAVMQGDDGGKFIMLARWFNPAGVPDFSGRGPSESVLLSMFEPRQQDGSGAPQTSQAPAPAARQAAPSPAGGFDQFDDSIPF